jgi:cell division protein FtsX
MSFVSTLEDARMDFVYACRGIRRNPTMSAIVVLTLTLGLGLNAVVFSVFNGLLFRAQVAREPESFARIYLSLSGTWRRK